MSDNHSRTPASIHRRISVVGTAGDHGWADKCQDFDLVLAFFQTLLRHQNPHRLVLTQERLKGPKGLDTRISARRLVEVPKDFWTDVDEDIRRAAHPTPTAQTDAVAETMWHTGCEFDKGRSEFIWQGLFTWPSCVITIQRIVSPGYWTLAERRA